MWLAPTGRGYVGPFEPVFAWKNPSRRRFPPKWQVRMSEFVPVLVLNVGPRTRPRSCFIESESRGAELDDEAVPTSRGG
jgi:hypothetical protein